MKISVELRTQNGRLVCAAVEAANAAEALAQVLREHAPHFNARPYAHLCAVAGPVVDEPMASTLMEGAKHG